MRLPVLIVPPGGVKVLALPKLAPHLFAPYESGWAWAAKLAAANALSSCEVAALLGISASNLSPLLPDHLPRVAQVLGRTLGFPASRIQDAFLEGGLSSLRPLMHDRLRFCPTCARQGQHFIIHQLRPFSRCPLHGLLLRDGCHRCGKPMAYGLGSSRVFGPINCPTCRAPQLPLSAGGQPEACVMSARSEDVIVRWLLFLRRRVTLPVLFEMDGGIDAGRCAGALRADCIEVRIPPRSIRYRLAPAVQARWCADMQHKCLEICYWRQANQLWRHCDGHSRQWYRNVIRGRPFAAAPGPHVLAFLYWRMTWQGCTNPYLLRRAHGLPLYGIAEWEANQCARDDDEIDVTMLAFEDAVTASWADWLDCIYLLGAKELGRHPWRLRAAPGTFASFPTVKKMRGIDLFAQSLRKST